MADLTFRLPHRRPTQDTEVACPRCHLGPLRIHRGCLATSFSCTFCQTSFDLAELSRRLDEEAFELLESLVSDRLSDRL